MDVKEDSNSGDSNTEFFKSIYNASNYIKSELSKQQLQPLSATVDEPSTSGLVYSARNEDLKQDTVIGSRKRKNKDPSKLVHHAMAECLDSEFEKANSSNCIKSAESGLANETFLTEVDDKPSVFTKVKPKKRKIKTTKNDAKTKVKFGSKDVLTIDHYSPPLTRNCYKTSTKELKNIEEIVLDDTIVVKKLKCENSDNKHNEEVSSTTTGEQWIANTCLQYGVFECNCCNNGSSDNAVSINMEKPNLKKVCSHFGVKDCTCCEEKENSMNSDANTGMEDDHLSISQIQPAGFSEDEEESNSVTPISGLPSVAIPKDKIIKKFLDSFTHDRIDYNKPLTKKIVEGLLHNPVTHYSEYLHEDIDAPEKTILERIDFLKDEWRLAKLNEPNPVTTPSFKTLELGATSTPQTVLNPILETDLCANVADNPSLPVIVDCFSENLPSTSELAIVKTDLKTEEPADIDIDLSTIDRSLITLRTPLASRICTTNENVESGEDDLMELVNDLVAKEEENIIMESQMRCQRMLEFRQNTCDAMDSALGGIELIEDDMFDNSVQIVDCIIPDANSDISVQFISDSDVEIVDVPSTSVPKKRRSKKRTNRTVVVNQSSQPKQEQSSPMENDNSSEAKLKGISDCSICLEPLHLVQEVSSTTCGHIFCTACIKGVIKAYKKCPICRKNLTIKKIHPLFLF